MGRFLAPALAVVVLVLSFAAGAFLSGNQASCELAKTLGGAHGTLAKYSSRAHDLIGTAVLIAGFIALVSRKGLRLHRLAGRLYLWSMFGLALSILPMLLAAPSALQLQLTVMATYLAISATVIARSKISQPRSIAEVVESHVKARHPLAPLDNMTETACAYSLLGFSLAALFADTADTVNNLPFRIPLMFLVLTGLLVAVCDVYRTAAGSSFRSERERLQSHVVRMVGSCLVILSAGFFNIANAINALPVHARWLIPGCGSLLLLAIAVPYFMRPYRQAT